MIRLKFRLDFLTSKSKAEVGQFVATVIDNNFATELISELAKAFLRAEDRNTQVRKMEDVGTRPKNKV